MRLIDIFVEKVLNTTESFTILEGEFDGNKRNYVFMQCKVGKAKYIYGENGYYNKDTFSSSLSLKPELSAIVSDDIIYVVNTYDLLGWNFSGDLPNNVRVMSVDKLNKDISENAFSKFYSELKTIPITDGNKIKKLTEISRERILSGVKHIDLVEFSNMYTAQDYANILCGYLDLDEETSIRLDRQKEYFINIKSEESKIKELINEKVGFEDWELELSNSLNDLDAKSVTVTFELNGVTATEKMERLRVIRKLTNNDYFSDYDFSVCQKGSDLLKKLGASDRGSNEKNLLCSHISEIKYRTKILYTKDQKYCIQKIKNKKYKLTETYLCDKV